MGEFALNLGRNLGIFRHFAVLGYKINSPLHCEFLAQLERNLSSFCCEMKISWKSSICARRENLALNLSKNSAFKFYQFKYNFDKFTQILRRQIQAKFYDLFSLIQTINSAKFKNQKFSKSLNFDKFKIQKGPKNA